MCSVKLSLGSNVKPRSFGFLMVEILLLLIVRLITIVYSARSGVKSVAEDLSASS